MKNSKFIKLKSVRPGHIFVDVSDVCRHVYRVRGKTGNLVFVDWCNNGVWHDQTEPKFFVENKWKRISEYLVK
jgi:hypothetical protein